MGFPVGAEIDRPWRGGYHRASAAAGGLLPAVPDALQHLRSGGLRPQDRVHEAAQRLVLVPQHAAPPSARPSPAEVPGGVDPVRRLLCPGLRFHHQSSQIRLVCSASSRPYKIIILLIITHITDPMIILLCNRMIIMMHSNLFRRRRNH